MGKIAIIFSGQGAQYPGMGRELYENSKAARSVFDCAEKIRPGTIELCFSGSAEELSKTVNTQPCLYCVDLAAAAAIAEAGVKADMLAGFSLGELAAPAFSGAVSYEDGFKLVCRRAELMQKASETVDAGMLAVLKLDDLTVINMCREFNRAYPVNYNCEGQVVVSCAADEMAALKQRVKDLGGRAMPLKTGGGFHSPFMKEASAGFAEVLKDYIFAQPEIPLYSNVTAMPYESNAVTGIPFAGDFKTLLAEQIRSPVLWHRIILDMIKFGADTFIEAGPGKTLCGLVSRISDKVRVLNVEDCESMKKTVEEVGTNA